ncbi:lysophospholipid acyltransferase family protein [Kineococcus gypseus]|uniref:lysophospholipid acyltransferase family protein n=1 Tax=Kineococcus gypseus TaxID=1637102 RepID=UPI003D7C9B6F
MLYWVVKRLVAEPVLTPLLRPWVRGAEHVPASGPAVLASNHLSYADPVLLPTVLRRRVTFIAKAEMFTGSGVRGRLFGGFLRGIGQLPVDRSGGRASSGAIDAALGVLARGELLGIYPEGTRSPDGRLYRGRTGVARIALRSGAPVLPVAVVGTGELMPRGRLLPRVRRVGVVIGEPMDFSRYAGRADDQFVLRSVTDEVMAAVQRLSHQEYVDAYALRHGAPPAGGPGGTGGSGGSGGPGGRGAPGGGGAARP